MRRLSLLLFAFLAVMFAMAEFGVTPVFAQNLCRDGQSMAGRNACICRPPLKFLPGDICGSGIKRPVVQQVPNANMNLNVCQNGANVGVSGCRCTSPDNLGRARMVYPGGQCNIVYNVAGNACKEGMNWRATQCLCRPPLKRSAQYCVR